MNIKTLRKWEMVGIYEHYNTSRSFLKSIDLERAFVLQPGDMVYETGFEVSIRQWTENAKPAEIDCVSAVTAFDYGARQVTNPATLNTLQTLVEGYCRENIDEIVEMINKKG